MSEEKIWNVLSLGAGVQSSCLALMAEHGEVKDKDGNEINLDFAIFSDTKGEKPEVYKWLDWLEDQVSFPIYRVDKGSLEDEVLNLKNRKKDGVAYMPKVIPNFARFPNGDVSVAMGRTCTAQYKIFPIKKKLREICGIKRGQKYVTINQWIGISSDEMQRMKSSTDNWIKNEFPLVDMRMDRNACKKWVTENGYPEPPRSSCYYCPFHSDYEWRKMRNDYPEQFEKAIQFDQKMRDLGKKDPKLKPELFLHRSAIPLKDVDLDNDIDKGQMVMFGDGNYGEVITVMDFSSECEGMCGV